MNGDTRYELGGLRYEKLPSGDVINADMKRELRKIPGKRSLLLHDKHGLSEECQNTEWFDPVAGMPIFRILLIGNDTRERQVICAMLSQNLNYAIEYLQAWSGKTAMDILDGESIDLIILEDAIEDMDGLEFLYLLRQKAEKPKIPIIKIFSANTIYGGVQAMQLGVRDYLLKDTEGQHLKLLLIMVLRVFSDRQSANALHQEAWVHQTVSQAVPSVIYNLSLQGGRHDVCISPIISDWGMTAEKWGNDPELHHQMCHEDDRYLVKNALDLSYRTGKPFQCEYRVRISDRNFCWFHDEAEIVADKYGRPLFMQGVMMDITNQKNLEAELVQYRNMLDQMVHQKTEQLERRVDILKSCNSRLCKKIGEARQMYADLLCSVPRLQEAAMNTHA